MRRMRDGKAGGDGKSASASSRRTCAARRVAHGVLAWRLMSACRLPAKYSFCHHKSYYLSRKLGFFFDRDLRTRCASRSSFPHHSSTNSAYASAIGSCGGCRSVLSASSAASISSFAHRNASTNVSPASSAAGVRASALVARNTTPAASPGSDSANRTCKWSSSERRRDSKAGYPATSVCKPRNSSIVGSAVHNQI